MSETKSKRTLEGKGLKVISAGLAKTGTTTMMNALKILGCSSVYDWEEHFDYHYDIWMDALVRGVKPDFKTMYANVDAVTDTPACNFFREILDEFPEAKVILCERDEEKWFPSWQREAQMSIKSVSYTHLTLPTNREV
eukprot:TRINITY_DN11413_c0_g1_i2.p1 TRINITY_DN11413_c0_g1~~TRINITY_DN11413_c0_g1_i2.p1  ORF type:complete len:138 (-),score=17.53 TRINITY_DN11413_c0_g1_i2:2-415(-)